jgi:hypothetical protein
MKRNVAQYELAGVVSKSEAQELIKFVKEFRADVLDWLKQHTPELLRC